MSTQLPTDFGRDLACLDDLTPTMAEVTGTRVVAEQFYRRLNTEQGENIDAEDDGIDLKSYLGDDVDTAKLYMIRALIIREALADERVLSATVNVTTRGTTPELELLIRVDGICAFGPFHLVLLASALTLQLLEAA